MANGVDVNNVEGHYDGALEAAVDQGHEDVVRFLIGQGANVKNHVKHKAEYQ